MFGFIADLITAVVSVLLPVFATYKAIRTRDTTTLTLWLIYWTTLALVLVAESQLYFFLRWVPLYSWIRLGVYVYLVAPGQKHGSFFIYKEYIHPFLYRHEQQIDQLINDGNTRAFTLGWELVTRGIGFVQAQVLAYNQSRFDMFPGRPAAMPGFDHRRRQLPDWDPRQSGRGSGRFEELDSEEEERLRAGRRRALPEDDAYFDGYNSRQYRPRRRPLYDSREDSHAFDSDEEEYYRRARGIEFQAAVKDKEDTLIQSALSRIARARAKGKTNPNLTQEEIDALERRDIQLPEPSSALATPPDTPTMSKAKPAKSNGRSNTKESSKASKKKSGLFGSSSPKSSSKAKTDRRSSPARMAEHALTYPVPLGVRGASAVYLPDQTRSPPNGTNSRSRSNSKQARRESTPPDHYSARYYAPNSAVIRPTSASSNRSLPDDPDWVPTPRNRASSNAPLYSNYIDYDSAPLPAAHGRRHASGPADGRYNSVRRIPPSSLGRPGAQHSNSDPSIAAGKRSGLSRQLEMRAASESSSGSEDDSDDDSDEEEVSVVPDAAGKGYSISRVVEAPIVAPSVGGGGARRRKGTSSRR